MLQGRKLTCLILKAFQVVVTMLSFWTGQSGQATDKIGSCDGLDMCEKDRLPYTLFDDLAQMVVSQVGSNQLVKG